MGAGNMTSSARAPSALCSGCLPAFHSWLLPVSSMGDPNSFSSYHVLSSNFRPIAKFCEGCLSVQISYTRTHTYIHIYIYMHACIIMHISIYNITSHRGRLNSQPCQPSYFSGFALLCISNSMRINSHRAYF